ncbi:MAG: hypothetical protein LBC79_07860 [Deltaproteobacteria bacterium]|jgi:multidrug efflux pump subunit AcrA (membrane-fusion protein)|nr:hypothetical protein [Deltaproteobacteria bacterium]
MISPEERAEWRKPLREMLCKYKAATLHFRLQRALDALEAEEAEAERILQESDDDRALRMTAFRSVEARAEHLLLSLDAARVAADAYMAQAKQAEAERDVLAGHLAELSADCPGEWDRCPFPGDCHVPPERFTPCWIAYARQQTQKRA